MKRAKEMGGKSAAAILIGPVTFISLAKIAPDVPRDEVLRSLLPIYGGLCDADICCVCYMNVCFMTILLMALQI